VSDSTSPGKLYELLGVPPDATQADITRAYHRRARSVHPDTQAGQGGEPVGFHELEAAYRVLRDPARRAAYDQTLRPPSHQPGLVPRAAMPPPSRAWPGRRPGGAAVWAGPTWVSPPSGSGPAAGLQSGSDADAGLAMLALLLAHRLGEIPYPGEEGWPW
jgi:curved DNA-binding protein CbpA